LVPIYIHLSFLLVGIQKRKERQTKTKMIPNMPKMYEPKNKDDLYLFKKAFKKRRLSRKSDKDIRKITSQWTITGPETAKKMFFRWYVHQIDDNLGSENFLNDNCAHLRHLDEDITIKSMKKICWQSVPCPFGFKRDFSPKRPNDTLKLDCR